MLLLAERLICVTRVFSEVALSAMYELISALGMLQGYITSGRIPMNSDKSIDAAALSPSRVSSYGLYLLVGLELTEAAPCIHNQWC